MRCFLTRRVKAVVAVAVVVVLATSAGGAYAYSDHTARQDAIARHQAAAHLAAVRTNLALAEDSAVQLETALTAMGTTATGIADARPLSALTAAVVVLKDETDKPVFARSAPLTALNDRSADLDAAVAAALATVPAVAESVKTVGAAKLAAAGSASAASRAAATSALAALSSALARHDDPRGLILSTISTVKAAQASHDAAVAAAAAAAAAQAAARAAHHSSGGGGFSAGPGAPVCASDVLTCVNQIRSYYGLHPLSANGSLNTTAQACADRMASSGQMTHSAYPGGWSTWGENIAEGYGSPVAVFNAWMASPGHRANILRATFTQMGIGHVAAGNWWCQQFGG
ncbi:MAG TPA: CAP domain-containing protein [Pseudolysinimonas sp.]|nr:CAP domain-containing protein [Pseudolysinimonas sp.]